MSSARPWRCVSGPATRLRRGGRSRSRGGREGGLGWTSVEVGPAIFASRGGAQGAAAAKVENYECSTFRRAPASLFFFLSLSVALSRNAKKQKCKTSPTPRPPRSSPRPSRTAQGRSGSPFLTRGAGGEQFLLLLLLLPFRRSFPLSLLSHRFPSFPLFNKRSNKNTPNSLRLTQFIETSRCRTHVRSALRASGAALVLVPSSSASVAAAVGSDEDGQGGDRNSSVVLVGLAAAVASEGLSAVPWARSAFDDTKAAAALQLAAGGWESRAAVEKAKYLSLGAAGALARVSLFEIFRGPSTRTDPANEAGNEARKKRRKESERERERKKEFFSFLRPFQP